MVGKYPRTQQIRDGRRERAIAVQAANTRTPQEQLAHLDKLGWVATKERAKIAKKLQDEAKRAKK
jgi:hypothetical protein